MSESLRSPAERALLSLEAGGEACAEMITGALDLAMDGLEQLSMSSPRKARRSLRDVSDRVEAVLECVDAEWCDGVSRCGRDELDRLCGLIVAMCGLLTSTGASEASEASAAVSDMADCLGRCGSVVVQSMGVLTGSGAGVDSDGAARVLALESLRGLSEARLECACVDEASVFEVVKLQLSGLDECVGAEAVSGCMALYTLGCRNGMALCGTVEVIELAASLYLSWTKHVSAVGGDYVAGAASCALCAVVSEWGRMLSEDAARVTGAAGES